MKIILIGFDEIEIEGIRILFDDLGEIIIPEKRCMEFKVKDVLNMPSATKSDWSSSKIVIIHEGEKNIRRVMSRVKSLQLGRIIYATTTPTSLEWKLGDLIKELEEEDMYFRKMKET